MFCPFQYHFFTKDFQLTNLRDMLFLWSWTYRVCIHGIRIDPCFDWTEPSFGMLLYNTPKTAGRHSQVCRDVDFRMPFFLFRPKQPNHHGPKRNDFPPSVGMNFNVFNFWPTNMLVLNQSMKLTQGGPLVAHEHVFFALLSFSFGRCKLAISFKEDTK